MNNAFQCETADNLQQFSAKTLELQLIALVAPKTADRKYSEVCFVAHNSLIKTDVSFQTSGTFVSQV